MELRKIFSTIFNILFPFTDFIYLLQQEEYSLQRLGFWFPRFFLRRNLKKRDKLIYTQRAKAILALSILLFVIINSLTFFYWDFNIFILIIICLSIPIIVLISNILLDPFYDSIKRKIIKKAAEVFKETRGNTKVIAITGSYGKTTVKNFIEQLVKFSYKTQMIPGNINSTIGIANWILNNYKSGTEVLIVEMDSYYPRRISESTKLVGPDIAIITNIGDQHLQRYKTKEKLSKSLFELFEFSPQSAIKITNIETLEYLRKQKFDTRNVITTNSGQSHIVLSNSNNQNLDYALLVTDILKIPPEYTDHLSKNLTLPDRRQSNKKIQGFDGIDDSYNVSFITAYAGITEALKQSKENNKKLLVITAGIPELGPLDMDKNRELGKLLEQKADKIFVLKSIFYKEIISGINNKDKISTYKNFYNAMLDLQKNYDPNEWFLLIQPELTDLYY